MSLNCTGICDAVQHNSGIWAKDLHGHSNHCIFDNCLKFSLLLCPLPNSGLARQICSLFFYTHCNYPCFSSFRMDYTVFVKKSCHCTLPSHLLHLHSFTAHTCQNALSSGLFPGAAQGAGCDHKNLLVVWFLGICYKKNLLNRKIFKGLYFKGKAVHLISCFPWVLIHLLGILNLSFVCMAFTWLPD